MASLNGARVFLAIRHNIFARQLNPINGHCRNALLLIPTRHQSGNEIIGRIATKEPFEVHLVKGKRYSWCRCGFSKKQPFCDGQHRRYAVGFSPLRFVAEETGSTLLCGCKQTGNPPFCDGTHMSDKVKTASID